MPQKLYDNIIAEDVLKQLYCVENKSSVEIANQYGCEYRTVIKALHNYGISIKHQDWENRINRNILLQMHNVENKSIRDIVKTYGASAYTIKHYLLKYNIPLRTSVEGRKIFLVKDILISQEFSDILDGLLLGDGNIQVPNNFQGIYSQKSNQKGFINYVTIVFKENNYYQGSGAYLAYNKNINKSYTVAYLNSKRTIQLRDVYNRWYPDGKKHVPKDIKLTPKTVLFWYLGDGHKIVHCNTAMLHTCSFSVKEQQLLVNEFARIGIISQIEPSGKYYIMRVGRKNNFYNFMKYMGKNPVSCYDYKFIPEFKNVSELNNNATEN